MSGVYPRSDQALSADANSLVIANSQTIQNNDFVTIDADGFLIRSAAGDKILGCYMGPSVTTASDNETVAMVKGAYFELSGTERFVLEADDTVTTTLQGTYVDIVLSTNAIEADVGTSSTTGQLFVEQINPLDNGSTTQVLVSVAELQKNV